MVIRVNVSNSKHYLLQQKTRSFPERVMDFQCNLANRPEPTELGVDGNLPLGTTRSASHRR